MIKIELKTRLERAIARNTKVLGMMAAELLADKLGGTALGGGNKQLQWLQPSGKVSAVGVGGYPQCFIKSSCKGTGRGGDTLKEGETFIHLKYSDNVLHVIEYTRKQIETIT